MFRFGDDIKVSTEFSLRQNNPQGRQFPFKSLSRWSNWAIKQININLYKPV